TGPPAPPRPGPGSRVPRRGGWRPRARAGGGRPGPGRRPPTRAGRRRRRRPRRPGRATPPAAPTAWAGRGCGWGGGTAGVGVGERRAADERADGLREWAAVALHDVGDGVLPVLRPATPPAPPQPLRGLHPEPVNPAAAQGAGARPLPAPGG